jgi:phosphodiesterase/alkaline phosphatase D-like protein
MLGNKIFLPALLWATLGAAAAQTTNSAQSTKIIITDGPRIEYVDDNSAKIAWTSSVEGSATVRYGTDRNNLSMVAQEPWGGKKVDASGAIHRVELKNLKANTTYYFTAESGQAKGGSGVVAKSDIQTLQTKTVEQAKQDWRGGQRGDIQAGPIAMNVTDRQAVLWWSTGDEQLDGKAATVKYGKDKSSQSLTAESPAGSEHRVTLSNLDPGTTYYFTVTTQDGKTITEGQLKTESSDFAQSKFRLTNGPVIETLGKDSAVIAWSTSGRSSSTVRFGTDPSNLSQTAQAPWGQQTHRVRITGLQPNTRYYFLVESAQAEGTGLSAKSNQSQFKTVSEGQQAMSFSKSF